MKPTIIAEGLTDVAILRALLPPKFVSACNLMPQRGGPRSSLSLARI